MSPDGAPSIDTAPRTSSVPSWRLIATLGGAGGVAGLLLVVVFQLTQPAIQAHKAEVLRQAVFQVLGEPQRYETLYVRDGALASELPEGADGTQLERVFVGYAENGERVGFAIAGAAPGFQDVIRLIFGFDPERNTTLGLKVLESKETPGLGDKIEKDAAFVDQFAGSATPLVGVKPGSAVGPGEVDTITGATISSWAVIRIMNEAIEDKKPLISAWLKRGNE